MLHRFNRTCHIIYTNIFLLPATQHQKQLEWRGARARRTRAAPPPSSTAARFLPVLIRHRRVCNTATLVCSWNPLFEDWNPLFKDQNILNPNFRLVRYVYIGERAVEGATPTGIPPHNTQLRLAMGSAKDMAAIKKTHRNIAWWARNSRVPGTRY